MSEQTLLPMLLTHLPDASVSDSALLQALLDDAAALIKALTWREQVPDGLKSAQVRLAVILFNRMGMDHYMSQAVAQHTTGITAATAVKVASDVTAGATKLNLTATSLTGKLKKGDLMKIGGKAYVVTKETAAAATNAISNVEVYPALPAIAANTDVTLVGSHTANLAFCPMAFGFATRPLTAPAGVESYTTNYNGISLRVVRGYDITHKREILSMDVLYGFKTLYPELAVRVLG